MVRRQMKKEIRATYAIVCEGYTEWYYFDYIKSKRRYPFKLKPELPVHSSYRHIFEKAKALLQKEEYSAVFCVFDLDKIKEDNRMEEFISECKKLRTKKIIPVLSFPCIEVWFLFHYQRNYSSRYYESYEQLLPVLRTYVPDYCKEQKYYKKGSLFDALDSADRAACAHSCAERSVKAIEDLHSAFERTFTEIGYFEKFLERCKVCVSGNCKSCWEEYFSSNISNKNS